MTTSETVHELLIRVAGGDPEHISALFAEDVDCQLGWSEAEHGDDDGLIRPDPTRADVIAYYREMAADPRSGRMFFRVDQVLVDGNDAVVTGALVRLVNLTARTYRPLVLHLTVQDGLVTRHHVLENSRSVARGWYW